MLFILISFEIGLEDVAHFVRGALAGSQHLEHQYLHTRDIRRLFTGNFILRDMYMGYPLGVR